MWLAASSPAGRLHSLGPRLYREDFRRLLRDLGCLDYRVVSSRPIELNSPEVEEKIGMVGFHSMTVRAFKLDGLEDICEDYGQVATYKGTIPDWPHHFELSPPALSLPATQFRLGSAGMQS